MATAPGRDAIHPLKPLLHARARLGDLWCVGAIGAAAVWLTFEAGQRGLFPFDQSIVFDGGYRILSGQVPYRDFIMPIGPVVFWLQAQFFRWFGVTYWTHILAAAVLNALAAGLSVLAVRMVFPGRRMLSYVAGFLTAVWFYPPFGTLYPDQTAFFFGLAALVSLLVGFRVGADRPRCLDGFLLLSGGLFGLTALTKQNVALFLLPLYPVLLVAWSFPAWSRAWRLCGIYTCGALIVALGFVSWLFVASDAGNALFYVGTVPGQMGVERIFRKGLLYLGKALFIGVGPRYIRPIVVGADLIVLATAISMFRRRPRDVQRWRRWVVPAIVCVLLIHAQHIFGYTTWNQSVNGLPFLGMIWGMAFGLLGEWLAVSPPALGSPRRMGTRFRGARFRVGLAVTSVITAVFLVGAGLRVSLTREVQESVQGSHFDRAIPLGPLRGLKWGHPTRVGQGTVSQEELLALLAYLQAQEGAFVVLPSFSILYGLVGRPAPQPLLWFHKGLTYPSSYDRRLDRWIVASLQAHEVQTVVLEGFDQETQRVLGQFPLLSAHLQQTFTPREPIGGFLIYGRAS